MKRIISRIAIVVGLATAVAFGAAHGGARLAVQHIGEGATTHIVAVQHIGETPSVQHIGE